MGRVDDQLHHLGRRPAEVIDDWQEANQHRPPGRLVVGPEAGGEQRQLLGRDDAGSAPQAPHLEQGALVGDRLVHLGAADVGPRPQRQGR